MKKCLLLFIFCFSFCYAEVPEPSEEVLREALEYIKNTDDEILYYGLKGIELYQRLNRANFFESWSINSEISSITENIYFTSKNNTEYELRSQRIIETSEVVVSLDEAMRSSSETRRKVRSIIEQDPSLSLWDRIDRGLPKPKGYTFIQREKRIFDRMFDCPGLRWLRSEKSAPKEVPSYRKPMFKGN